MKNLKRILTRAARQLSIINCQLSIVAALLAAAALLQACSNETAPLADLQMLPVSLTAECLSLTRSVVKTSFVEGDELTLTATYAGIARPAVVYTLTAAAPATWEPLGGVPLLLPSSGDVTVTATHTITDADEVHSGTDANVTLRSTFGDDLIATATTGAAATIVCSDGQAQVILNFDHRHALLKINIVDETSSPYPIAGITSVEVIVRMDDGTTNIYYRLGVDVVDMLDGGVATPLILPIGGGGEQIEAFIVTTVTGHSYRYTPSPAESYVAGTSYGLTLTLTYEGITSFTLDESDPFGWNVEDGKDLIAIAGYDYVIRDEADLRAFAAVVNGGNPTATAIQVDDIVLKGEWVPIGNDFNPFMGVYNGNGYTISGMRITTDSYDFTGFFGHTYDAILTGIHLRGVEIQSNGGYTGALVGYGGGAAGCISLCSAVGEVEATTNAVYVGGLVGANESVDISRCRSECSVSATGVSSGMLYIGGLVGYNYGPLSACQATGSVIGGNSGGYSAIYAGGLVGWNYSIINSCYATGETVAGSDVGTIYAGGLVGYNSNGAIYNSYATGGAEAEGGATRYTGTLVGFNDGGYVGSDAACHASGNATGNDDGDDKPIGRDLGNSASVVETDPDKRSATIAESGYQYQVTTALWEDGKTYSKDAVSKQFTASALWTKDEDEPKLNFKYNGQ